MPPTPPNIPPHTPPRTPEGQRIPRQAPGAPRRQRGGHVQQEPVSPMVHHLAHNMAPLFQNAAQAAFLDNDDSFDSSNSSGSETHPENSFISDDSFSDDELPGAQVAQVLNFGHIPLLLFPDLNNQQPQPQPQAPLDVRRRLTFPNLPLNPQNPNLLDDFDILDAPERLKRNRSEDEDEKSLPFAKRFKRKEQCSSTELKKPQDDEKKDPDKDQNTRPRPRPNFAYLAQRSNNGPSR